MICVAAHDAGGAEVVASLVARQGLDCVFVLQGPAVPVFERRLGPVPSASLEDGIARGAWLLCGTSWQSDLEWRAIDAAKRAGKRAVAFVDHWGHYRERFVRSGVEHLPDEIWVGDPQAEAIARDCFPDLSVRLVPNPYFEDVRERVAAFAAADATRRSDDGLRVLFVCEPLSEHGLREFGDERHWGYTENDALRYFFANAGALGRPLAQVVVRPHPAEPAGKYDWVGAEFGPRVSVGGKRSLLEEIAESDIVVGCESMAMVVGLMAGRRTISCIPPGGMQCAIPLEKIESLQRLVAMREDASE